VHSAECRHLVANGGSSAEDQSQWASRNSGRLSREPHTVWRAEKALGESHLLEATLGVRGLWPVGRGHPRMPNQGFDNPAATPVNSAAC